MKVLAKTEDLALRGYAAFRSLLTSRGQGSLEYIAIAVGIVVVLALAVGLFGDALASQGACILDSVKGDPANTNAINGKKCSD